MRPERLKAPGMTASRRRGPGRRFACLAFAALAASGCGHKEESHYESALKPPTVQVTRPEYRTIVRTVGQPSFVESYERTSIYPKLTGYIEKWFVDIGDEVKKGDVLAKLFVPEVVEDFQTKKANVLLDKEEIELAKKDVEVADAEVKAAKARVDEARSMLGKYEAEVARWEIEVKRLRREVERGVVDPQILLESTNQWKSDVASRDSAVATIKKTEADLLAAKATLARADVKVSVTKADLAVATSEANRLEAWVGYLTITAPFDGVVVARNANTFDFVLPGRGDPTADTRSPYLSPSGGAAPIYVVDRTDVVRIFVDIPEAEADYVHVGSKATVLIQAFRDEPIEGTVTRTSWALNVKSRTLRAEVDLTNPVSELLPGMYAYAEVIIERPGVRALPVSALTHTGDKTYCWLYKDGRARRAEVRTGVSDGEWIEVTKLLRPTGSKGPAKWQPVNGSEKVILGDLSTLAESERVEVDSGSAENRG